jgi:polynucleotide 5'-kinase involved in rRNA processing
LIATDLVELPVPRHRVLLGKSTDREAGDDAIWIDPYGARVMVCGTSGSGKSTLTTGLLERLCALRYQFAVVAFATAAPHSHAWSSA